MMAYVWYPIDRRPVPAKDAAPYLPGLDEALPKLAESDVKGMFRPSVFRGIDLLPQTDVVEDAPIASGRKSFPLLLFSHGWGNPTFLYTAELEDVVSHGYPAPRREARQRTAGCVEVGPAGGRLTDTAPTIDAGCKDGFVRNQLGVGVISSTDEISHCLNAGGMRRQDFETETLIAHSLSADGFDASEDGTGRGTPMVPVAILGV